jgi:hypothetical protein
MHVPEIVRQLEVCNPNQNNYLALPKSYLLKDRKSSRQDPQRVHNWTEGMSCENIGWLHFWQREDDVILERLSSRTKPNEVRNL